MGIGYAMKSRSDLRRRDLVVAATVGLPQSVPRRSVWDVLDECVGLLASTEGRAWADRRTLADLCGLIRSWNE
jgi:hypothetical protein